jgi:benzoyl-CoA reductase/2-hydroxyglutaryl-CoA dehydratase subunit BcrC/BadD/HgdB
VTLLCVILRKMLDEFELNDTSNRNLYITRKLLRVELETFFKEKANRMKLIKELNRYIEEVAELGYLKKLKNESSVSEEDRFEVRRILKARFDEDTLQYFLAQMKNEAEA